MKMKGRAFLLSIAILVSLIIFCGCNESGFMLEQRLWKLNNNPYENVPQNRIETFVEAISNEDCDAIYDMFSQEAKENGVSDDSLKELIEFLKSEIYSLFDERTLGQKEENNYGVKFIRIRYAANVIISETEYKISFSECVRDDNNADRVGLTRILVFPADSESLPEFPETGVYVIE